MGSSGGGGDGAGMMALMGQGTPMPGLPVAGKDSTIGDPYEYGKFQNFLPEIQAEGQNPMATGLRPDMFKYRSPSGILAEGGNSGGGSSAEIQGLRDELAALKAGGGSGNPSYYASPFDPNSPVAIGGGGGAPQTMGMGGRGGGPIGPAFYPDGQTPVQMQGRFGGTDQYGRGNFASGPMPSNPMPSSSMPLGSVWPAGGSVATDGRNLGWSPGNNAGAQADPAAAAHAAALKALG